jgi:signal transduction histidine kinase
MSEYAERQDKKICASGNQGVFWLNADSSRLRQVFINIIDNAIKYSPKGGKIEIFVDISKKLNITIKDSGSGIAKKDLPFVKQKFYKANKVAPGSGIGLAVADEIVTIHGGKLEITSIQNKGTTVEITL